MSSLAIVRPTVKRKPPLVRLLLEVDGVLYQVHRFSPSPALIRAGAVLQRVADGELFDIATMGESFRCKCGRFGMCAVLTSQLCPHVTGMLEAGLLPRYPAPNPIAPPRRPPWPLGVPFGLFALLFQRRQRECVAFPCLDKSLTNGRIERGVWIVSRPDFPIAAGDVLSQAATGRRVRAGVDHGAMLQSKVPPGQPSPPQKLPNVEKDA